MDSVIILGKSGGTLPAYLTAYRAFSQNLVGIRGVIGFYGLSDLTWGYVEAPRMNDAWGKELLMTEYLCGGKPTEVDCSELDALVAAQHVPTLSIFGLRDESYDPMHAVR